MAEAMLPVFGTEACESVWQIVLSKDNYLSLWIESRRAPGGWLAKCYTLPECEARGRTKEEAEDRLIDAIARALSERVLGIRQSRNGLRKT